MLRCIEQSTASIPSLRQPEITAERLWMSIQEEDFRLPVQDFLWKILQGALRCGSYWANIPGYETRALCATCRCTDSPEHILTQCVAPGSQDIWRLTRGIWERTGLPWPTMSLTVILRAGIWKWKQTPSPGSTAGPARLWRILISESAYLIWKLRCTRVIQNEGVEFTEAEVVNKWFAALDQRLDLDRRSAARCLGAGALDPDRVAAVWAPILDATSLPPEWVLDSGVLVGIKRGR